MLIIEGSNFAQGDQFLAIFQILIFSDKPLKRKSEDPLTQNWFIFNVFNSFDFILVLFPLCLLWTYKRQFFQGKFTVTSIIRVYTKMYELLVNTAYDHQYISLTPKKGKFHSQAPFFVVIATLLNCNLNQNPPNSE